MKYFKAEILIEVDDDLWCNFDDPEEKEWLMFRMRQEKHFEEDTCQIKFFPLDLEDDFPCHVIKIEEIENVE